MEEKTTTKKRQRPERLRGRKTQSYPGTWDVFNRSCSRCSVHSSKRSPPPPPELLDGDSAITSAMAAMAMAREEEDDEEEEKESLNKMARGTR